MAASAALSEMQQCFQKNYYPPTGTPWPPLTWRGVPCQKTAYDLWRLGELVWALRPGLIIETGTAAGGTALFLADMLELLEDAGDVWTVDIHPVEVPHGRVECHQGSSLDPLFLEGARYQASVARHFGRPVLVILDSDHHAAHVAAELAAYAPLVTVGSYLVVEDTNLGDTVMPEHGPGPSVALAEYLAAHPGEWEVARDVEPPLTTNPNGYWRRVASCTCP